MPAELETYSKKDLVDENQYINIHESQQEKELDYWTVGLNNRNYEEYSNLKLSSNAHSSFHNTN